MSEKVNVPMTKTKLVISAIIGMAMIPAIPMIAIGIHYGVPQLRDTGEIIVLAQWVNIVHAFAAAKLFKPKQ